MIWPFKRASLLSYADVRLEREAVFLRPAMLDDYSQWLDVRSKNQLFLRPFEPQWPKDCLTKDFFYRRVENLKTQWNSDKTYNFLVFEKHAKNLVGGINVNNVCRGAAQYGSLGYWLSQDCQGKGYMTMAGKAALEFSFFEIGLHRMNAATLLHNQKSKNLLHRLGFVEEGMAKKFVQINGLRQDHLLFGLNADDFLAKE